MNNSEAPKCLDTIGDISGGNSTERKPDSSAGNQQLEVSGFAQTVEAPLTGSNIEVAVSENIPDENGSPHFPTQLQSKQAKSNMIPSSDPPKVIYS